MTEASASRYSPVLPGASRCVPAFLATVRRGRRRGSAPTAGDQGAVVVVVTGADVVGGVTAGWTVIVWATCWLPWPRAVRV